MLGIGLSGFGMWDPWEVQIADAARQHLSGDGSAASQRLRTRLIAWAFSIFGVHGWSGRLIVVAGAVLCLLVAYWMVSQVEGRQAGIITMLVLLSMPLFILNSRPMFGASLSFLAQTVVGWGTVSIVFTAPKSFPTNRRRDLALLAGLCLAVGLAIGTRGALLGALPVLMAGSVAAIVCCRCNVGRRTYGLGTLGLFALTFGLMIMVALGVIEDSASYSIWLGGSAEGLQPPSFDKALEQLFHGLAPWSALLPAALGVLVVERDARSSDEARQRGAFRLMLILWIAFCVGAELLYTSRYGQSGFLAVVPAAALVGIYFTERRLRSQRSLFVLLVSALLVGLILRDFTLFPVSPLGPLGFTHLELPETVSFGPPWAASFGLFLIGVLFTFGSPDEACMPDLKSPYRLLAALWRRSWAHKIWLGILGLLTLALMTAAALTFLEYLLPFRFSVLAAKVFRVVAVSPLVLALGVAGVQWGGWLFAKLGTRRFWPLLAIGLMIGGYVAQGFIPEVSAHFSPQNVYATFNRLARAGEPLGEYQVGSRTADYYTSVPLQSLKESSDVIAYLLSSERRWVVLPFDQLTAIDHAYRKQSGRHIFVATSLTGKVLLATNQVVSGHSDHNPLKDAVRTKPPVIEHHVSGQFGTKVELLGYSLDLPHKGFVGARESFKIRWVFRVREPLSGSYRIFLHIDGHGQRLNGDHDPVHGLYPSRYWEAGDIIVDEQELKVPINFRPGDYGLFLGFYSGSIRLRVEGVEDNRLRAGTLPIR